MPRFTIYGHKPTAQDPQNSGLSGRSRHSVPPEYKIHETDSEKEAKEIMLAGGFIQPEDQQWYVATRWEDSTIPAGLTAKQNAEGTRGNAEPDPNIRRTQPADAAKLKKSSY